MDSMFGSGSIPEVIMAGIVKTRKENGSWQGEEVCSLLLENRDKYHFDIKAF